MTHDGEGRDAAPASRMRPQAKRILTPIALVAAVIYFLIDALFLPVIRRFAALLGRLRLFARLGAWIASLGPYPTLALFLVPLVILEPVKPVAAYLFASGHLVYGAIVLVVGEVLKITIVERLFHLSRDKLLTIPAFAWAYHFVVRWLDYLKALPAWQAVMKRVRWARKAARRSWLRLRACLRRYRVGRRE